jgi:hypothetical protein
MNLMRLLGPVTGAALAAAVFAAPAASQGNPEQLQAGLRVVSLRAEPAELSLQAGQSTAVQVVALDAAGNPVDAFVRIVGPRTGVRVDFRTGQVTGLVAGTYDLMATVQLPPDADREVPQLRIPLTVTWPAIADVRVQRDAGTLYVGTTLRHRAEALHADGSVRPDAQIRWTSSDPAIAAVDRFGNVTAHRAGSVTITAAAESATTEVRHTIASLSLASLELEVSSDRIRTGDVISLSPRATTTDGRVVDDVPLAFSYTFIPDDTIAAPGAAGRIMDDRFVAEVPGTYTLIATAGPAAARRTIDVRPREAVREVEFIGQGSVSHVHTSDLWVYEGLDGRDYAVTGTWGGDGYAYFWDVTDPANLIRVDSIQVDARTVNDVKVSPDGRYAALSREGASNRRNGVVIVDLANPRQPKIAANFDDGLTGGVHNMFALDDYLFALSGGDKYVILDVRDIYNPKFVSEYNHPDSRIHDVWVSDGIAYSSEWGNGVVVVDVGNGRWGGTIENPKFVTNIPYPVGRTHAAFPYFQQSTGKFYLFLGDEILNRRGAAWAGTQRNLNDPGGVPSATSGYYHIIDFTDPENPKDVARYEVPEFGTHNLWIEDDVLFTAYYDGGLRMVDVSGELLGNLANQGREIAVFKPYDPSGFTANAPMVWGPQPHKGNVFFSDFNSGLWSVKLLPPRREAT